MVLKNILHHISPRNILHLNVKFSGDLLFRPLDENCIRRKCVKESTYLAGQKTSSRCTIVRVGLRDRFIRVLHVHTWPSNPHSISAYNHRCYRCYKTSSTKMRKMYHVIKRRCHQKESKQKKVACVQWCAYNNVRT